MQHSFVSWMAVGRFQFFFLFHFYFCNSRNTVGFFHIYLGSKKLSFITSNLLCDSCSLFFGNWVNWNKSRVSWLDQCIDFSLFQFSLVKRKMSFIKRNVNKWLGSSYRSSRDIGWDEDKRSLLYILAVLSFVYIVTTMLNFIESWE